MRWFKRFVNDFSFDFGFVMALFILLYYAVFAGMLMHAASRDSIATFIPGSSQFALGCFALMFAPALILFALFYIYWSKSRLESHEDVVVSELLEDKETLKKLLK